jgi:integrase
MTVPAPLMAMLAEHLKRRGVTAADPEAYVFVGPQGGPLEYSGFRQRVWCPACQAIGLPGLGFHDLRRANATVQFPFRCGHKDGTDAPGPFRPALDIGDLRAGHHGRR